MITAVMCFNMLYAVFLGYLLVCHYDTMALIPNLICSAAKPDIQRHMDGFSGGVLALVTAARCALCIMNGWGSEEILCKAIYPIRRWEYIFIFLLNLGIYLAYIFFVRAWFADSDSYVWMPLADSIFFPMFFTALVVFGIYRMHKQEK